MPSDRRISSFAAPSAKQPLVPHTYEPEALGPTDMRGVVESTLSLASVEIARTARLRMELHDVPLVLANVARIAPTHRMMLGFRA